jgi:hypothetical protein
MKNKGTLLLSILLCVCISIAIFSSCSKSKTNAKLVGKWKLVDVANIKDTTSAVYETWEFTEEFKFVYSMRRKVNQHDSIYSYTGKYSVDKYNKITIWDFDGSFEYLNGTWSLVRCKDGNMMLVNDLGGLYFREFTKL